MRFSSIMLPPDVVAIINQNIADIERWAREGIEMKKHDPEAVQRNIDELAEQCRRRRHNSNVDRVPRRNTARDSQQLMHKATGIIWAGPVPIPY